MFRSIFFFRGKLYYETWMKLRAIKSYDYRYDANDKKVLVVGQVRQRRNSGSKYLTGQIGDAIHPIWLLWNDLIIVCIYGFKRLSKICYR